MLRIRSRVFLFCGLAVALMLTACYDPTACSPVQQVDSGPIGDLTRITVQVLYAEVLKISPYLDAVDEFRFFMVAGDEDPTYLAELVYPASENIAVRAGDVIDMSRFSLSVDAITLDGKLYVYFAGIDSDKQDAQVNQGIGLINGFIGKGLAYAVVGGLPDAEKVTAF